jgi:hypothetical protein
MAGLGVDIWFFPLTTLKVHCLKERLDDVALQPATVVYFEF